MPRKKSAATEAESSETSAAPLSEAPANETSASVTPDAAEPPKNEAVPAAGEQTPTEGPANPEAKNWGDPYKAIFACNEKGFEMGENRRFRQRVFRFAEKPPEEVIAVLKEVGFTYRAAEKSWTIPANPDTRKLSDDLAREFAGQTAGLSR